MSSFSQGEVYFIAGMMLVILVFSIAATYIFVRQYRRERNRKEDAGVSEKKVPGSK